MKLKIVKIDKEKAAYIQIEGLAKREINEDEIEIDLPHSIPIESVNCEPEQGIKRCDWVGYWGGE